MVDFINIHMLPFFDQDAVSMGECVSVRMLCGSMDVEAAQRSAVHTSWTIVADKNLDGKKM